jgi:uncharacterized repeat protein (TIGR02543 family)
VATLTLNCTSADSSPFKKYGQLEITYAASNGTFKITELKGCRTDDYRSYDSSETSVDIIVGGTTKSVSLSHYVDFGANESWKAWGATDTTWSGLTKSSVDITVVMPSSTAAFSGAKFTGTLGYTITYNANGGSLGSVPSTQTKIHGEDTKVTSYEPTRTGYTFKGWSVPDRGYTDVYYSPNETIEYDGGQTLKAVWAENKLTVNYYRNNADYAAFKGEKITTDLVHSQQFYYDNSYSDGLANIQNVDYVYLSRTGYAPTGYWGTSSTGGTLVNHNTSFATGQALAKALGKSLQNGDASVNVYAQWQANAYTLTYDSNGGFGSMNPQTVEWGESFNLLNNTFKRGGYKFVGWNAYRNDDNTWYAVGQGWVTKEEIIANGYKKKVYENQCELTFDNSWIRDNEEARLYTMYAIWKISGVIYIDNGTMFEPCHVYIDNGENWDLYIAYVDDGTKWNIIS